MRKHGLQAMGLLMPTDLQRVTQADPGGMATQARSVCDVAEELDIARRSWRNELTDASDAFDLRAATAAFEEVRDVWQDEFRVYHEVLEHWCNAARAAAAGYTTVDEYVADQQHRIPQQHRML